MAIKQFAIPLDGNSTQSGDRTIKELAEAGTGAEFQLTNVSSSSSAGTLNLITKKAGATTDHTFNTVVDSGKASVTLSVSNLATVFQDAVGGNWDYVEARWTIGVVDTPKESNQYMIQSARTYNLCGWPPNS